MSGRGASGPGVLGRGTSGAADGATTPSTFRPLTRAEIERCMRELLSAVAASIAAREEEPDPPGLRPTPRWVPARELVRRMQPYVVMN